jgi:hypothetical protein
MEGGMKEQGTKVGRREERAGMEGVGRGREEEGWKERRESRDGRSEGRAGNERRVDEGWKERGKFKEGR